jgi:hypothetical protein
MVHFGVKSVGVFIYVLLFHKVFHVKSTIYVNIAMQYPRACNLVTYSAKFDFGRSMRLAVGFSAGYLEALFFTTQLINIGRSFCVPFLYICPLIILCVQQVDLLFLLCLITILPFSRGLSAFCMLNELVWFDGSLKMFLTKTRCWTERTFGMVFAFAGCTLICMELRLG